MVGEELYRFGQPSHLHFPFLETLHLRAIIYLAPEDTAVRARRMRSGGNRKKCFTEGWVEFADKRRAKRIASTLNNTPMGGGHRSFYAHDLWNVKYLSKFRIDHFSPNLFGYHRQRRYSDPSAEGDSSPSPNEEL